MPTNPENSTKVITHSGESKCNTVTNPINEESQFHSSDNAFLGKRYNNNTSGFRSLEGLSITEELIFQKAQIAVTVNLNYLAPDFDASEVDLSILSGMSYWAPNLIPPIVHESTRGAFSSEDDNTRSSYGEEHPFYQNAKQYIGETEFEKINPIQASSKNKQTTSRIMLRRLD